MRKKSNSSRRQVEAVRLEDIVNGKLPDRVIQAIGKIDLTVNEWAVWQASKSPFHIACTGKELLVEVNLRVSMKKFLALLGTVGGGLWLFLTNLDKIALLGKALSSIFT